MEHDMRSAKRKRFCNCGKMSIQYSTLLMTLMAFLHVQGREDCPLWTTEKNGTCLCDDSLRGLVKCEDGKGAKALVKCYCMTTGENSSSPVVGNCLYTCTKWTTTTYIELNTNKSEELNNQTCGPFHRTGVQCSKCVEGYGLPVYSYSLSCVECKDYKYNWIKYIAVAYGPLTVFYILGITFRISATSGLMISYVTISQMLSIRKLLLWATTIEAKDNGNYLRQYYKVYISMVSIWNLDFFRSLYAPFCLSPRLATVHILMLDYFVAIYPLVLIAITYTLVKLHDRYRIVVWLCKPLHQLFSGIRREWEVETSLVGSLATFYLLSYVKVLNVTADVLTPIHLYNSKGDQSQWYSYYNASNLFASDGHLPYAVFAIVFSLLFNLFPLLLLCLYPCACFHKCLNMTGCRCHTLHIFMDALLGAFSYKPRERRYFGALYLTVRIVHVLAFLISNPITYLAAGCYIVCVLIVLILIFQPYRNPLHNKVDLALLSFLASGYFTQVYNEAAAIANPFKNHIVINFFYILSISIIPLYGLTVLVKKIVPWLFIKQRAHYIYMYKKFWTKSREMEEPLPHRMEYSETDPILIT